MTDGLADVRFPAFDAGGKYLWFTASTDYGPSAVWLDLTSVERAVTRSVWLAVLAAKEPSPFGPESDEEPAADAARGEHAQRDLRAVREHAGRVDGMHQRDDADGQIVGRLFIGRFQLRCVVRGKAEKARWADDPARVRGR